MPQEHYVLRCFSCETFQAHIVKKSKKWECKICGVKQSVKRNYGKGSGKDCRIQVMRLNELRLSKNDSLNLSESEIFDETFTHDDVEERQIKNRTLQVEKPLTSKWAEYLEEKETDFSDAAADFSLDTEGKKKKRIKKKTENFSSKKKKIFNEFNGNEGTSQGCGEKIDFSPANDQNLDFYNEEEQDIKINFPIQSENEPKPSKYMKYIEEQENENITEVKKKLNLFDSDITDLDSILNF